VGALARLELAVSGPAHRLIRELPHLHDSFSEWWLASPAVERISPGGPYRGATFPPPPLIARLLRADLLDEAELLHLTIQETGLLRRLDHPNLVAFLGWERTAEGRPCFVQELLV